MNDEKFLPASWLEKINDDESKKRVIIKITYADD